MTVRVALAMNPAAPHGVDQVLTHDPDECVRTLLARKVARELPGLRGDEQAHLRDEALARLAMLVEDEAVRVRAALSSVLEEMQGTPHSLILQLARDCAVPVSEPLLHLALLLDAGDLLALLASPPHERTIVPTARRVGLSEAISEAVAATADREAVRILLSNPLSQTRESTLDALISRAERYVSWREPVVRGPRLPVRAMRALSRFMAAYLIEAIWRRGNLDPHLAAELDGRLTAHLARSRSAEAVAGVDIPARHVQQAGFAPSPDEAAVIAAAQLGDTRRAALLLAAAANVPLGIVDRACTLRSAKGVVSLVWRAGFTMRAAGPLQTALAKLSPDAVLQAGENGHFPLSVEEMSWHCDFLAQAGR